MAACSVYIVESGDFCKVGLSNSPAKRMGALSTSSPVKPALFHTWRLRDRMEAQTFEKFLHQRFRWARERGEWFRAAPNEVQSVGNIWITCPDRATTLAREIMKAARLSEAQVRRDKASDRVRRRDVDRSDRLYALARRSFELFILRKRRCLELGLQGNEWDDVFLDAAKDHPAF